MQNFSGVVALLAGLFFCCGAAGVATAPSGFEPPAEAPSTRPSGFGQEAARLVEQPDEIVSRLKNGALVIAKRVPSPVVSVRGYVHTGGIYEGKWLGGGLSHLLEHLVAGGSSQRRTEAQNRDLLQKIGNNSNAYTSTNLTAYFINTTPEHMSQAVDLVTGWMLGALITPAEFHREQQVVQRELEKDMGEPDWVFYDLAQRNRYGVSPAGVPVIGYQPVIQKLTRDDVYSYYKRAYVPNNMIFAVAGDLDPEKMLAAVQKYVDHSPPGRAFEHDIASEPPVVAPRTVVATFPKLGQARLEIAFPTVTLYGQDMYPLDLLATILGGGESSILTEDLRDKQHLVYSVSASDYTPSYVTGTFAIDMELNPKNIPAATEALLKILDNVSRNPISSERVKSAKVQMRADRVKSQQTSEQIASSMATDLLDTGDPHFRDVYVERVEGVTSQQLQRAARQYFVKSRMLTTALIPEKYAGAQGLPRAVDLLRKAAPTTQSIAQASKSKVTRIVLPNGTILLHKRISTSPLVVMQMMMLGGLTDENAQTNGIGNLTMQMLPRGTKSKTAEQIAEFWDAIGGDLSTACGHNTWYCTATCLKGDFAKAFDQFADVIKNPTFPAAELTPMKQRITARIAGMDSDWTSASMKFFRQAYFGPKDSPYQFIVPGTKENVSSFTTKDCADWYHQKVLPARKVLAIYGDVSLDQARQLAEKNFSGSETASHEQPATRPSEALPSIANVASPSIDVERVAVNKTQLPVAGIVIGYDSNSVVGDPAHYPLAVAQTMAGGYGYPTGYLFEILRGRGLVYEVAAENLPGRASKLPGTFIVFAGCDADKVNEVVNTALENIARLQGSAHAMQPNWFTRSKQLITTSDALERQTPAEQAMTAALDELFGLGYDYHDKFDERIDAVTLDQVRGIARNRLVKCVVTISTPQPQLVNIKTGERTYGSFPPVELTPRGVQHDVGGK